MKKFNEMAKEWREAQGFTQWALARKLNVYPQSISSFECGRTCPGHLVISYLEAGMGEWLYGNQDSRDL